MQHDHVLKKLNFDLLAPRVGVGVRGGGVGSAGKLFYYHVAAFMIPFNLICTVTMF